MSFSFCWENILLVGLWGVFIMIVWVLFENVVWSFCFGMLKFGVCRVIVFKVVLDMDIVVW